MRLSRRVMIRSRKPGFWIAVAAGVLSVSLCVASILFDGRLSVAFLVVGGGLFLPVAIYLASQLSGRPLLDPVDVAQAKKRPIFDAALFLASGLMGLGPFLADDRSATHTSLLHHIAGAVSVGIVVYGGFSLVAALVDRYWARFRVL